MCWLGDTLLPLAGEAFLTTEPLAAWWSAQLRGRNLTLPGTIVPEQDYKYSLVWPGSRILTQELGCLSESEGLV